MSEFIERSKDSAGTAAVEAHFSGSAPRSTPGAKNVLGTGPRTESLGGSQTDTVPNRDYFDMFDSGSGTNYKRDLGTGHKV